MIMAKYLQYILFVVIIKESISIPIDPNLNLDYDDIKYLLEVLDEAEASVSSSTAKASKIPKASLPQLNSKQSIDELLHLLLQQKDQIDNFKLLNGDVIQDMNLNHNNDSVSEGSIKSSLLTDGVTVIPMLNENKENTTIQTNSTTSVNESSTMASVSSTREPQLNLNSNKEKGKENLLNVVRSGDDDLKSSLLTGDSELDKILSEEIAKLADEMASGNFRIQPPSSAGLRKRVNKPVRQTLPNVRMPQVNPVLSSFPALRNPPAMDLPSSFLSRQPFTSPVNANNQVSSLFGDIKPQNNLSKPKKNSLSTVGMNGVTRGVCKYISKEGYNVEINFVQQQESAPPTVTKTSPPGIPNSEEHLQECMRLSSKTQTNQYDSINFVSPTRNQDDKAKEQTLSWRYPETQGDQTGILTGFTGFSSLQQPLLDRQDKPQVNPITQLDKDVTTKLLKLKRMADKMKRNPVLRNRHTSNHIPTLEEAKELKLLVESYIVLLLE